jgi:hypothetical protein
MIQTPVLKLKPSEREYFVSRIRSGLYIVKYQGLRLKIYQPTIEDELELQEAYIEAYDNALKDSIQTEEEMISWMKSSGLWSDDEEQKMEKITKDIEKLKIEIFSNRTNDRLRETVRAYLRAAEKGLQKLQEKKMTYYSNTCEGLANSEKLHLFIKKCTYLNGELFDFKSTSITHVLNSYYSQVCSESTVRYLARSEPWRSLWALYGLNTFTLFANKDRNLSIDQRNIITWSKMYDNVYESMDCPSDDVIEDDDLLDGWFAVQRKKRENNRAQSEIDQRISNDKIKNSSEVFLMAHSSAEAQKINSLNDDQATFIKKQREELIKKKGVVSQQEFRDEQMRLGNMAKEQFKSNFGR